MPQPQTGDNAKLSAWLSLTAAACVGLCLWATAPPPYVDHHPPEEDATGLVGASRQRSSKWPAVQARYLREHPACEACGSREDLNVHHVVPFHVDPSKELDPRNLLTLCREHHLSLGHSCGGLTGGDNWKCENPNVRADVAKFRKQKGLR